MTNTFNTKFPTYWKEDKVEELKYYQSKEFWCKFVDYLLNILLIIYLMYFQLLKMTLVY